MEPRSPHAADDDEPRSPRWLPLLGVALFLAMGLLWWLSPDAPPPPATSFVAAPSPLLARAAPAGGHSAPSLAARPAVPPPELGERVGFSAAGAR